MFHNGEKVGGEDTGSKGTGIKKKGLEEKQCVCAHCVGMGGGGAEKYRVLKVQTLCVTCYLRYKDKSGSRAPQSKRSSMEDRCK